METEQLQRQKVTFGYEVFRDHINLYDRVNIPEGEGVLRFLTQVPIREDIPLSVKIAVDKYFEGLEDQPSEVSVDVRELKNTGWTMSYLRKVED